MARAIADNLAVNNAAFKEVYALYQKAEDGKEKAVILTEKLLPLLDDVIDDSIELGLDPAAAQPLSDDGEHVNERQAPIHGGP